MLPYVAITCVAALVTVIVTGVCRKVAWRFKILTPVRERDVHTEPIPRLGGIGIATGFIASLALAAGLPAFAGLFADRQLWTLMVGTAAIALLGLVDDIWELDWAAKLAGQILVAGGLAYGGVQLISIPLFGVSVGSSRLSLLLTVLIFVTFINAVNFVDGLDGLASGIIAISAVAFFLYCLLLEGSSGLISYITPAKLTIAALLGACLGFLPHNFHPARIFMGDSGSMSLGVIVAAADVMVTGQLNPAVLGNRQILAAILPIALALLVVAIPLLDMILAVLRRLARGQSPFKADRGHLHHRLLRRGHSHRWVVFIMYLWTAVILFPTVALIQFSPPLVAAITAPVILALLALTANVFSGFTIKPRRKRNHDHA
ncbi:MraY family glycosyltransferase [Gleimia hominis]|uniref:MraY family glycosyltransferase n=1 Tax=Gleimia hominis TaxID=595468 RepID=A0ABU3IAI5_9ACTO|nr:MraY family glycosyltransferase [Gleimia hominis]MDT3767399.1 MraY family glycosyltransferase [Gleimia hominis]WIK64824.1 MraY family glycosyltransferase [Gleimia hominis]